LWAIHHDGVSKNQPVEKNAKMHLEKMKKDCDDLELQNQAGAKKIKVWS
jgi:hypothetical protein